MAEPELPPLADLISLSSAEVRTALLARGIGISEPEVARALSLLKEDVTARVSPGRGRLTVGPEDGQLRAGNTSPSASRVALDFAVDWFAGTFLVGP